MSKTAILFPGQGAQYFNMGNDFYNEYEEYKEVIDKANLKLDDLIDALYINDDERLTNTLYTQFAISSMEVGIYEVIKDKLTIEGVAGFSLGEYAALYVNDVIDKDDFFEVINLRTKAMLDTDVDGAMIAVLKVNYDEISEHLKSMKEEIGIEAYIANYNSDVQIVISCLNDVVTQVVDYLKGKGIRKVVPLKVSGPFHSIYYKDAAFEFKQSLKDIKFSTPTNNLYLNTTGKLYTDEDIKAECEKQMYTQVNWLPIIKNMINDGYDKFIEVGPGQVLSGLMKKIDKNVTIVSIEKVEDLQKLEDYE